MPKKSKEKRIQDELDRISNIFEEADGNDRIIIYSLLQNAAFMKVTLEDLQEIINAEGVTEEYQNGANQRGVKQSATLQSYNALIKNYTNVVKALLQYVPPEKKNTVSVQEWLRNKTEEELAAEKQERDEGSEYWAAEAARIRRIYGGDD